MTDFNLPTSLFDDEGEIVQYSGKFFMPPHEVSLWNQKSNSWGLAPAGSEDVVEEMVPLPDDYLPPDWPWPT